MAGSAKRGWVFVFSTSGHSTIDLEYLSKKYLAKDETLNLLAALSGPVKSASFKFTYPYGTLLETVDLYDDGLHEDGIADDGLYGGTYTPTTAGSFYFNVEGNILDGTKFKRIVTQLIRVQ